MQIDPNPELFPILSVLDDNLPPGLAALAAPLREAIYLGTDWVTQVIAGPHPQRKGSMCPFVPKAINTNRILLGIEQGATLGIDAQKLQFHKLAERYLGAPPSAGSEEMLTTLLILYPHEDTDAQGSIVGHAVRELKMQFLEARRMIGVFTFEWDKGGDEGTGAEQWRNPMPVLAMRHMVQGDDFFLNPSEAAMAIYRRHYPDAPKWNRLPRETTHTP